MHKNMSTINIFTLFPHLPIELRLKIWSLAILSLPPRIINLQRLYIFEGCSAVAPPSLLHATRESRSVALSIYQRWKRSPWIVSKTVKSPNTARYPSLHDVPYIYISPSKDIFTFTWCDLSYKPFGLFPDLAFTSISESRRIWDVRERIVNLIVPMGDIAHMFDSVRGRKATRALLKPFTAIEKFDISVNSVMHAEGWGWRAEEYFGEDLIMVDFVDEGNETVRMTAVEALRTVIGGLEGVKRPAVRAMSVVDD